MPVQWPGSGLLFLQFRLRVNSTVSSWRHDWFPDSDQLAGIEVELEAGRGLEDKDDGGAEVELPKVLPLPRLQALATALLQHRA